MSLKYAFNLRLSDTLVDRIDRIKDRMSKSAGVSLTRAMVIRALLEKGAEQYELVKPQVRLEQPNLEAK